MAYDIGAKVGIEGEAQFKQSLKTINSAIKANATELKSYTAEYDRNERSMKNIRQENKLLSQSIQTNKEKVKTLTSEYTRQEAKLKELERALEKARRENGENSEEAIKAENAYAKQAQSVNNLESQINTANAQINTFTRRLEENGNAAIFAGEKISAAGDKISGIGTSMTMALTVPLAAVSVAGLKVAMDFEAGMSQVKAITQATGKEFNNLRDLAIDLGANTAFSSSEVAEAMTEMAKAGWTSQQIMDGMSGVLDAAAASGENLGSVSTIIADAITGFGLSASDSTRVADLLTQSANAGTIGITDLGESFKYAAPIAQAMGYNIEDVTTAISAMSMSGIKGSQAGTSLRTLFTNMAKPTKAMAEAMSDLGIKLYDTEGNMYSMKEMIDNLRGGFSEFANVNDDFYAALEHIDGMYADGTLTAEQYEQTLAEITNTMLTAEDAEKARTAAMLAGKEGLSGLLTLVNMSQEEYDKLSESMYNSAGVAQETAAIMQDNLANKVEQFGGAAESLAIRLGDYMLPALTDITIKATEMVEEFTNLNPEMQQTILKTLGIAAAAGPTLKVVGSLTKGVGNLTSYMGKTVKSMSSGGEAATGLASVLKFAASPAGGVVLLTTAIAALGIGTYLAMEKAKKAAIDANLDEHFGNIKLSAEEVTDVVKHLTENTWTITVESYIDEKQKIAEHEQKIKDTVASLNKMDWIVKYGMEIEPGEYKAEIDNYIQSTKDYVQQKGYTVDLAIKASFATDSAAGQGISSFASGYYGEAHSQLDALGQQLADIVNDSFANNTFAENRVKVEQIRQQMADLIKEINEFDMSTSLGNMELSLNNMDIGIDYDSYNRVTEEVTKFKAEILEKAQAAQSETVGIIQMRYKAMLDAGFDKSSADAVKQEALKEIELYYADQELEVTLSGINFGMGEINKNFGKELSEAAPFFKSDFEDAINQSIKTARMDGSAPVAEFSRFFGITKNSFVDGTKRLSEDTKGSLKEMLRGMEPLHQDLNDLADVYRNAGTIPPKEIAAGLADAFQKEAMAGNVDNLFQLIGMQMADSPEFVKMIENAEDAGVENVDAVIKGMELQKGLLYDTTTNTWNEISKSAAEIAPGIAAQMNENGMDIGNSLVQSLANQYGIVYDNAKWMMLATSDGAYSALPDVLNTLAAAGVDIPDGLIAAMNGKTAEVQNQAALLLTEISTATEAERPGIIAKLGELGIAVPDTLVQALNDNKDAVGAKSAEIGNLIPGKVADGVNNSKGKAISAATNMASAAVESARAITANAKLTGPGIDKNNTINTANIAARAALSAMQLIANNNPIVVQTIQRAAGGYRLPMADGGVFNAPTQVTIGETYQKEYIIPVERPASGVPLLQAAAADLGFVLVKSNSSNYAAEAGRESSQANSIKNTNSVKIEIHKFINNTDQDIEALTETISSRLYRGVRQTRKGMGRQ